MTKDEVLKIIEEENLNHYNLCENRSHGENELGIQKHQNKWLVYATDERASVITGSEVFFDSESDAFDSFIKRLRAGKRLEKATNGKYY